MGPEGAKSFRGVQPVRQPVGAPVPRATQEIDYGRRGKGYIFGAFQPATGAALTAPYGGRTIANWVDFLLQVEAWLPADVPRVYAVLDNLSTHRARDVLLTMAIASEEKNSGTKPAADLLEMEGMDRELAYTLANRGVITMEDLAEQAVDDLMEIDDMDEERAAKLIMTARAPWFADEKQG